MIEAGVAALLRLNPDFDSEERGSRLFFSRWSKRLVQIGNIDIGVLWRAMRCKCHHRSDANYYVPISCWMQLMSRIGRARIGEPVTGLHHQFVGECEGPDGVSEHVPHLPYVVQERLEPIVVNADRPADFDSCRETGKNGSLLEKEPFKIIIAHLGQPGDDSTDKRGINHFGGNKSRCPVICPEQFVGQSDRVFCSQEFSGEVVQ